MKKWLFAFFCFSAVSVVPLLAEEAALPKVLIIGDSISIGYTPHVKQALAGRADVVHHKGNAQHTETGLARLDAWLGDTAWDVIHFNWGLWDLCYRSPDSKEQGNRDKEQGTITTPLEEYEKNLRQLVQRLKQRNAILIWASISVVPEGEAGRKLNDDLKYNAVAEKIMREEGIQINDLNALSRSFDAGLFKQPGDVHFTSEGYQRLARQVVEVLSGALKLAPRPTPPRASAPLPGGD